MPDVELRDGFFPHPNADFFRQRRVRFQDCFQSVLMNGSDELVIGQVFNSLITRAADVVENHKLAVRLAVVILEKRGGINRA